MENEHTWIEMMSKRSNDYDFLRFIGILSIILAHTVSQETWVFQLRNFDVPLMVMLSGISYLLFSSKHHTSYLRYLVSRFIRLVVPVWIFLVCYGFVSFLLGDGVPSFKSIVLQLLLLGGTDIGVWIIRIFVTMAIIAPFIYLLHQKLKCTDHFYLFLSLVWTLYEVLVYFSATYLPETLYKVFTISLFFTFSYGVMLLLGMRLAESSRFEMKRDIVTFATVFLLSLLFLTYTQGGLIPTQLYKYPPQLYYLSYAVTVSLILIYFTQHTGLFDRLKGHPFILFIGRWTLWIYLWHWMWLKVYTYLAYDLQSAARYLLIVSLSVVTVFIQYQVVLWVQKHFQLSEKNRYYLPKIFTG